MNEMIFMFCILLRFVICGLKYVKLVHFPWPCDMNEEQSCLGNKSVMLFSLQ